MRTLVSTLAAFILLVAGAALSQAGDWPQFRGPDQTGVAAAGAAADWPAQPALEVVWKADLGPGYSGLAIADGSLYTGWGEGESDWLGAFDAATGARRWMLSLGPIYDGHDGSHTGPIATPVVAQVGERGLIFAVGGHGRLVAANTTGEAVWSRELSDIGGAPFYGFSASPLVVHGAAGAVLVMEVASGEGPTVVGFEALTGEVLWQKGDDEVHYQSPVLVTLGGRKQVIASGIKTLYGLDGLSGELLWSHDYGGEVRAMGSASNVPVHLGGDLVLVKPDAFSSIALSVTPGEDAWRVETRWTNTDLARSYAPALRSGDHVFGYKGGFLVAVNTETGETAWRSRPPGDGFLAAADGHLLVATKKGSLHLARATGESWSELASLDLFDHPDRDNAVWSEPAIAGGDIYVRSMSGLARVAVRSAASVDATVHTASAGLGDPVPPGAFAEFLDAVQKADDKAAAVDAFLARQSVGGFPIVEGEHAIFVLRSGEGSAGIEGDMLGDRTQGQMRNVPGTDLYYFVRRLPRDTWISYRFVPGMGDPVVDPLNSRQVQVLSFRGPEDYSFFTMPDWHPADHMLGEPATSGRMVHHDVPLPLAEGPASESSASEEAVATEDTEPAITSRGIDVFLPDGFGTDSGQTYPVIFAIGSDTNRQPLEFDRALAHYLGRQLPQAVVVLVGSHHPNPMTDVFGGSKAAADSFFHHVVPFVVDAYPIAAEGPDHAYVGFAMTATQALELAVDDRSRAGRVSLVQPFFLDSDRDTFVAAAKAKTAHRPHIYLETSPLTLRAEHEGWHGARQAEKLATDLRGLGYEVTMGSSNLPFVPAALRPRVGDALAFALTGTADVPAKD